MSDFTLCSEKGPTSCRSLAVTSEPFEEGSLARDSSDDPQSSNGSLVSVDPDSDVLVVDWDGPHDPSNPKK